MKSQAPPDNLNYAGDKEKDKLAIGALNTTLPLNGMGGGYNGNLGGGFDISSVRADGLNGNQDQSSLSNEANGPDGEVNPNVLKMMYETRLQSDLQSLERAKSSGDEQKVQQATEALGGTYGETQQKGIQIDKELDTQVKQALGISDGENGGSGGGGNLDALNDGGFNADDGGSGGGGGGGGGCNGGGCNGGGCVGGGGGGGDFGGPPRNLSEEDKKFLNQAISQDSQSFGDLVSAWRQGPDGNCSTVATIKAAMDRYDNKVFDEVTRSENGYNIVMQDGYKMTMSDQELAAAKQAAQFRGPDGAAKSYATFLYGAAAKRNALDNGMSLGQSFQDLNNGESIYSPAKSLGLQHQMVRVNPRNLNGQDSVVAGSHRHAVFVNRNADGSHTTDLWGRGRNFNGTDGLGNGLINAYTFKPRGFGGSGGGATPAAAAPRSRPPITRSRPTTTTRTSTSTTTRRR